MKYNNIIQWYKKIYITKKDLRKGQKIYLFVLICIAKPKENLSIKSSLIPVHDT